MSSVLVLYLVIISTAFIVLGFIRFSQKCVIYIPMPLNQQEFQEIVNQNQGSEYKGDYDDNYNNSYSSNYRGYRQINDNQKDWS